MPDSSGSLTSNSAAYGLHIGVLALPGSDKAKRRLVAHEEDRPGEVVEVERSPGPEELAGMSDDDGSDPAGSGPGAMAVGKENGRARGLVP